MEVEAVWQEGMRFEVASGSGHTWTVDGPPELGGANAGPRPMELMLASAVTCSGIDVVEILRKGRRSFDGVTVKAVGERSDKVPKVFTRIELRFAVRGADPAHAARAVELSASKYCSALRMLDGAAEISWSLEA
ncbi:MAG: OsmC family protein [Betaproteobacteria bacterium AqS2]|uniref:OsmC family protein n=1 Tax=Candidatus Amphirhobacter heronislandensis TaxID=1732024 RepID=A0A930UDP6_9GAMM|nr:OsmC family protein [Betaproteobacteria bacterium AqS2]